MPSATTADSRDSMAPRSAKATASGSTAMIFSNDSTGSAGICNMRGISPKRVPMVSTGRCSSVAASDATTIAISMPGHDGRSFFNPSMMPSVTTAIAMAAPLAVPMTPPRA